MKDVILNEVMKELNWKERIIVKVFAKTVKKTYHIIRHRVFNNLMQF